MKLQRSQMTNHALAKNQKVILSYLYANLISALVWRKEICKNRQCKNTYKFLKMNVNFSIHTSKKG